MNQSIRILVVDDDSNVLNGTARLMENAGYTVDKASNGDEALQSVRDHHTDLLLLDRKMPGIDGLEVCRRIKQDAALADTFVVIVSGVYTASDHQAEGFESGADGYIVSPIANREMLARVESYVRILLLTRSLRLQTEELKKSNEAITQAHLASLNLMEDTLAARDSFETANRDLRKEIVERKEAQEERVRLTRQFELLLANTDDGIYNLNLEGLCTFINRAGAEMIGWGTNALIGHNMHEAVHHHKRDGSPYPVEECPLYVALKNGNDIRVDTEIFWRKDGTSFSVEYSSYPIHEAGVVTGAVVTFRDITQRKQAEAALRDSEERFRQLAENIDEVFWIANPADDKILYVSPAFEKIWGLPCKILYKSRQVWLDTIHREDREQVLGAITTKQNRGEYDETYRIVRPDGLVRWIHDRAFPLKNSAGEVFRVVGTASDVTANRNLEMQFNQSQKMEAFGLLAGGVAHDFNNLMSVVMGYSDIWLLKLPLDSPIRVPLMAIRNAGERASSLTKQLLAFSRQTVLESKVLDLNTVVRETEKMLGRLIGEDIVLSSILNPAIPRIKVDPGQIGQVLMNLAINARDAMPHGGNLTIETRTVDFDDAYVQAHLGTKTGRHVMLSVSDTGTGMPPEIVARIFEPFFTTKGVGKGTGLGLAVVYGIISQSGGNIEVESKVGIGTTFKVYFPVTSEKIHPASKSEEIEIHAGIETILVVEDEESLLEIAKESLESFGYTVLTASSGPDALKLVSANEGTIDLMLTDVVMPGMSGRELADTLKQKLPELKVIFMSGYTDDSVVRHGVNHEKVAFLQKPFAPFDLLKKVREELDKHSNMPALQIP